MNQLNLFQVLALITLNLEYVDGLSKTVIQIEKKISGAGFHRTLETTLHIPKNVWDHLGMPGCSLLMLQVLPSGIYADPFQLQSLQPFGFPKVLFDRKVDIEVAEYAVMPHDLYVFLNMSDYMDDKASQDFVIDISLPIHARYHKPQSWSAYSDPVAKVTVPHPRLYSNCSSHDKQSSIKAPCNVVNSTLCHWTYLPYTCNSSEAEMKIPVGEEKHKPLVVTVTLLVTIFVCAFICKTIYTSQNRSKDKMA